MLSLAHAPTTRLMAYMAAVLSAAGTLPRVARPDSSTRAHTLHGGRAVDPIFTAKVAHLHQQTAPGIH
jgi:hypothetical protein